jgi:protein TonB
VLAAPHIEVSIPPLEIGDIPSRSGDFKPNALATTTGADAQVGGSVGVPDSVLRADQVEKQVSLAPGSVPPKYPDVLRNSGIEGQVIAQFVVDERGRAEDDSVRFVASGNSLFEEAVRVALRRMRFVPAEVGGRKVRQLVQMPFVFTLSR